MRTSKTSAIALSLFLGLSATAFAQTTPGAETTNPSETENNAGTIEQITPGNQAPGTTTESMGSSSSGASTMGATGSTNAVPENTNPSESEQGTGPIEELTRGCAEGQIRASVDAPCMAK